MHSLKADKFSNFPTVLKYIFFKICFSSRKVKDMSTCSNNQVLYQYALNLPDMNIQHLPLLK